MNKFKNQSLIIFYGKENPIKFELKLSDFYLIRIFFNLNKVVTIKLYTKELGDKFHILRINNKITSKAKAIAHHAL